MRGLLPLLLAAGACVTQVASTTVSFPARSDWRSCARGRLQELGYRVTPADTAAAEIRAGRRGRHLRLAPDDEALTPPRVRVEMARGLGRPDVDSLVVSCGAITTP